jgi:hypothetical protein
MADDSSPRLNDLLTTLGVLPWRPQPLIGGGQRYRSQSLLFNVQALYKACLATFRFCLVDPCRPRSPCLHCHALPSFLLAGMHPACMLGLMNGCQWLSLSGEECKNYRRPGLPCVAFVWKARRPVNRPQTSLHGPSINRTGFQMMYMFKWLGRLGSMDCYLHRARLTHPKRHVMEPTLRP